MSPDDIVRAWKDPDQRRSGVAVASPAGEIELVGATAAEDVEAWPTWVPEDPGCWPFTSTCTFYRC